MKHGSQKFVAEKAELSRSYISEIINGKKRVTKWPIAKRLCQAVPGTSPELWLDGTPEEIRAAIKNAGQIDPAERHNEEAA